MRIAQGIGLEVIFAAGGVGSSMTFWRQHRKAAPTFFREFGRPRAAKSSTARTNGASVSRLGLALVSVRHVVELALGVDCGRVRLPARCLHHLSHEPTDHRRLCLGLRDLVGVLVMISSTSAPIAERSVTCASPAPRRARADRRLAPDDLEDVLGNLAGNRSGRDQVEDRPELRSRYGRCGDVPCPPC